jgi:hypothetical protein
MTSFCSKCLSQNNDRYFDKGIVKRHCHNCGFEWDDIDL